MEPWTLVSDCLPVTVVWHIQQNLSGYCTNCPVKIKSILCYLVNKEKHKVQRVKIQTHVKVYSICYFILLKRKWQQRNCPSHKPDLISLCQTETMCLSHVVLLRMSEVQIFQFRGRKYIYFKCKSEVRHPVRSIHPPYRC